MRSVLGVSTLLLISISAYATDDLTYNTFSQPCRIIDTRLAIGGALASGTPRDFKVAGTVGFLEQGGNDGGCGVPAESSAVLINFVAVNPTGGGNLRGAAFPLPVPTTGSFLNYQQLNPILNIANGLPFPICDHSPGPCAFDITIQPNGAGTHLVADVLGYFLEDHKHDGADITTGTVAEPRIDSDIARDSEIFPTVLANDGPGSTLNADRLDDLNSSDFAAATHSHAGFTYQRTVVVPAGGTPVQNGTALLNAMAAITGNSATNTWLLKIEPGIFDLGTSSLDMKDYVDIEGSGEVATTIRRLTTGACLSPIGTIRGSNNAEVRYLTAENNGIGTCSYALELVGTSPRVSHVTLRAQGGTQQNVAVDSTVSGTPVFSDVSMSATGGTVSAIGLRVAGGSAILRHVRASASGSSGLNIGVYQVSGGTTRIQNSVISGSLNAVRNDAGTTLVGASQLIVGGANQVGGTLRCFAVYDGNFQNAGGLTACP